MFPEQPHKGQELHGCDPRLAVRDRATVQDEAGTGTTSCLGTFLPKLGRNEATSRRRRASGDEIHKYRRRKAWKRFFRFRDLAVCESDQPGSRSSMPRRFRNPDRAAVHFLPSPASSWLTYFNIRELTSRLIFSHSAGVFPRHGIS